MTAYDFEIFHKLKKINFANKSLRHSNYEKTLILNIKFLSLLQSKFTLSKNIRDFLKIFDDVFKITNVRKFDSALNAKNLKKIFENATMRSDVQKFEFSKNIKDFQKMFENALSKSNVHVNAFI